MSAWIALSLLSALAGATTSLTMKRAVARGGVVPSTIAYRLLAALLLAAIVASTGAWPSATPAFWHAVALVLPPESVGVLCMMLALRSGELSEVQPIFGLIPLFAMLGAGIVLHEVPSIVAAAGVVLLALGIYTVGLRAGRTALEPLRALARSTSSRYAVGAAVCFGATSVIHKLGIAAVGPLPWAVTLAVGSACALAVALPLVAWRWRIAGRPSHDRAWGGLVLLSAVGWAVQQIGLQTALRASQTSYVVALTSTSVVFASALGVLLLGERAAAGHRIAGSVLVGAGAALVALGG